MNEEESIDLDMTQVTTIVNQWKMYDKDVIDHKIIEKVLLITLSKKFDSIFVMIQEEKYLIQLYSTFLVYRGNRLLTLDRSVKI